MHPQVFGKVAGFGVAQIAQDGVQVWEVSRAGISHAYAQSRTSESGLLKVRKHC